MSVASSSHSHITDASAAAAAAANSTHGPRLRLGSVGDSVPASDSSEGTASETFEHAAHHWPHRMMDDQQQQYQHLRQSQQQPQQQQQRQSYRLSGGGHSDGHSDVHTITTKAVNLGGPATNGHHQFQHMQQAIGRSGGEDDEEEDDERVASETGLDSLSLENGGVLSELERGQVESFFSGLGTEIFVCPSLANLYENCGQNDWRLVFTGVPVLLHDKGSTRSRSLPRVTLVLAERGTCFALWQDTIDHLSEFKIGGPAFHTMCMSSDHAKLIGFSYDSNQAAHDTWHHVERLMADPANIALSAPGRKRAAKQPKRPKPAPLPPKSQISAPCQFQHVTSVAAVDMPRYFSLQAFVNATAKHRSH